MKIILNILILALFASGQVNAEPISQNLPDGSSQSKNLQAENLLSTIRSKAASSEKGVILAIAEKGEEAADTAWLLAEQFESNKGYATLLVVTNAEQREPINRLLNLKAGNAPALVIYDRRGKELSHIVNVRPSLVPWRKPRSEAGHLVVALDY